MPIDFAQLSAVIGPTAAVFVVMYLNRKPDAEKPPANPMAGVEVQIEQMRTETRKGFADMATTLAILMDRSNR
jgi:hypothetical protein